MMKIVLIILIIQILVVILFYLTKTLQLEKGMAKTHTETLNTLLH